MNLHNTNLIKLISTLTRTEFREFGMFVNSPYYNREKVLVKFFNYLKKFYPDYSEKNLEKKKVFSKLFSGKKYNDALLRNTVSDFLKLTEDFIRLKHFENEKFYGQYLLLKELTNRKLLPLFKSNFKKADKILNSDSARDEIYFQNKFLLEDEWRRNHVATSSRMLFEEDNLKKQSDSLHVYYLTEFTKLYAILLNQSRYTYDYKFDFELFEAVIKYLQNNFSVYKDYPYINIFYNCVMLYKTEEQIFFNELKKLLLKHYRLLTLTDRKNIFVVLINYCSDQIDRGNYLFLEETFIINEHLLKSKAYFEGNDFMPHYFYEAIALNAIEMKKTDWAEKFLIKYNKLVHQDYKDLSYNYCMAELTFSKGNPDKSLGFLSLVLPENVKVKTKINILLLKIHYTCNNTVQFSSLIESSKKYIIRNKTVQEINKLKFSNFLKYIGKLYKVKSSEKIPDEIAALREEIINCPEIFSKKWLEDQIEELST
ncbi:MAG: hypothetical protein JSS91_12065 [Bacteroidetes bacterium]|nr:hypothetical protein [Bacteroidota bacterium]